MLADMNIASPRLTSAVLREQTLPNPWECSTGRFRTWFHPTLPPANASVHRTVQVSVAVLAEIPLRSPQKIFIFIIKKIICWVKVSKNKNNLILEKTSLVQVHR